MDGKLLKAYLVDKKLVNMSALALKVSMSKQLLASKLDATVVADALVHAIADALDMPYYELLQAAMPDADGTVKERPSKYGPVAYQGLYTDAMHTVGKVKTNLAAALEEIKQLEKRIEKSK